MQRELLSQLKERGYRGQIVSLKHLAELREEIEGRYRQGLFDEKFYRNWLMCFVFEPPASLPEAKCLIVVSVPQPQYRIVFTWKGEPRPLLIPPTYVGYNDTKKQVEKLLAQILGPQGYGVERAKLPEKLLAVRSGLAAYGRNNICYVPGMGSFQEPVAFFSDLPCEDDTWQEARMMDACENCTSCLHSCPTGAIASERFLLHAERCITFHNEQPGDVAFPNWMDPSWHNSLVGCMLCQKVCPQNKEFVNWAEDGPQFSEAETALVLKGVPLDQLPAETAAKWKNLGLDEDYGIFPRNLIAFVNKGAKGEIL